MMRALLGSLFVVSVLAGSALAETPAPSAGEQPATAQVQKHKKHHKAKSKKARKKAAKHRQHTHAAKPTASK